MCHIMCNNVTCEYLILHVYCYLWSNPSYNKSVPMLILNAIVTHFQCVKSLFVELNRANWEMKSQETVWRPFKAPIAPVWSAGRMREEEWEVKRLDWCVPASSSSTLQSWDYLELLKLSSLIPSASLTLPACTAAPSVPIRFIFSHQFFCKA